MAGGPLGKLRDGDLIEIIVDGNQFEAPIIYIGREEIRLPYDDPAEVLKNREIHVGLQPNSELPDDTKLWAELQSISGGIWRGCVYDVDKIIEVLEAGKKALAEKQGK